VNIEGYETIRANATLWGRHQLIMNKLDISYRLYYLQSVQDGANYIFRFDPTLLIKIPKSIAISYKLDYRYESVVDPINTNANLFMTGGIQISNMKKN
jgi:hypothetical protein